MRSTKTESRAPVPSFGIVVPAHQAAGEIGACIEGLMAAGFVAAEVIVVDDGSRDATGDIARAAGARVLVNAQPLRPAAARNRGVSATAADVVVFVDADVVVHADARARLEAHFASPALSAVFGSYDDTPAAPRAVSRYRNLLHHFVHQHGRAEAQTFWTGFGAVRRADFVRLGGLDSTWEDIEDVEFGLRLTQAGGRIRLDAGLLATHLKEWTVRSMFRTDLKGRAIPWTRLLAIRGAVTGDLNTGAGHRASAAAVAVFVTSLPFAAISGVALVATAAATLVFLAANHRFLTFLWRRQGLVFALIAIPCHALHYCAALLGFAWVMSTEAAPGLLRFRT